MLLSLEITAQSSYTTSGAASYCLCNASCGGFISTNAPKDSIKWESSTDNVNWIAGPTKVLTYGYSNVSQTTCYRVIVSNGTSHPDTSNVSCVNIYQQSVGGAITGGGTFCSGAGFLQLTGYAGNILYWLSSIDGGNSWDTIQNTSTHCSYNVTQNTLFKVNVRKPYTYCGTVSSSVAEVKLSASKGGTAVICPYKSDTITGGKTYCVMSDSGIIKLTGYVGSILHWSYSMDGGNSWSTIAVTDDSLKYSKITQSITYQALVQLGNCTIENSTPVSFTIKNTVAGKITNADTTVEYKENGNTLQLSGNTGSILEWQYSTDNGVSWSAISNTTSAQAYEGLITTTKYRAVVQNDFCKKDTTNVVTVNVLPRSIGKIINLFTPNGDGINDTWYIKGLNNFDDNEVFVYDIYGHLVFNQKAYKNDWKGTHNGSDLPDGTYYYVIKFSESDKIIKGSVDILRGK